MSMYFLLNVLDSAVLFLGISILLQCICIILYAIVFAKLPTVKYYRLKAASEGSKTVSSDLAAAGIQKVKLKFSFFRKHVTYTLILKYLSVSFGANL